MSLIKAKNKPIILHFEDANGTGSFPIAVGKLMSEYRKKLKRSMRGVQIFDAYDPSEARDPSGKWTEGGGGSAGKTGKARAVRTPFIQNLAETSGANRTQWIKELAEKEKNRPGIISQAAHAAVHGAVHLLGAVSKEDYEELKEHLAPRSPARETYAHYIRRLATTPYFLIKSHIKEEYHKFKNAAGALKSLATGHNPTHEQWRGLRQAATTVALTALVFMMTGEPTGTAAHAAGTAAHTVEQIAEHTTEHVAEQIAGHVAEHGAEHSATAAMAHLAEEFGHEMMWHTIYEHSAKFGLGTARFAAAAIVGMVGEHATEGKETKDAEPNNQTGSFTPDEIKLLQDYFKTLANVVATYPIPDDELRASLTNNKSQDAFDPEEKRDESGKWTSGGGSSRQAKEQQQTVSFVSPNEDPNNLSFEQAHQGLKSPRQKLLAGISHRIDQDLGIKDVRVNHVIGAWSDGAENSVMTNSAATDPDIEEVAAVMKGYLANQKAVLLFHPDDAGHQFLAQFRVASNDLAGIHKKLLQSGVIFHTLEPRGNDTLVHCYGEDEDTLDQFGNAAKQFDQTIDIHRGHGKFIPPEIKDGTDAEQRAASKEAYQQTIRRVEAAGKLPRSFQSQWQNHIDNWERETGERIGGGTKSADKYDPSEARDPGGKWTATGGSEAIGTPEHGGTGERGRGDPGGVQSGRNRSVEEAQGEAKASAAGRSNLVGLPDRPISLHSGDHYVPGPIAKVHEVAEQYMKAAGLPYNPPQTYKPVDQARATSIADAFANMKHDPQDPKVKASYQALAKETIAQWHAVKASGLKVEWIKPGQEDPYAETPRKAAIDVERNNHWWGFPTDQGFGSGEEAEAAKRDNPLLEDSGEVIDGRKCCVNDIFRIVHDYFGHFKEGVGFRASGEENAWRSHASMYSKEALPAVTSETRGQNSWVNFGPYGETNQKASAGDTHYAPQKIGLMPEWTYSEGREDEDMPNKTKDRRWKDVIIHTLDGVFRFSLKDAEFKREEHPFAPAGTPGSKGGQFVAKGTGGAAKAARAPKATKTQQQRANTPPRRTTKPTSVKVRQDNGTLSDVELPQDVVAHARTLKEAPDKYFKTETPGTEMIPVEKLVQTRARPEGIAHAVDLMAKAYQGEGGKRGPIHVQKLDDGNYLVLDGNSTTTIATAAGWEHLPALVIPDASYLPKKEPKEPKHAGEREAAERAIQTPAEKPKATKPAKPPAPAQSSTAPLKGSKGHPGMISTALPKGKGDEYNKPNLELAKSNPKVFAAQIQVFKDHPSAYPLNQQELQGDDNTVARNIINHIKSNLIFIHDQTPKEVRERTKKWYEGARKLVDEHVENYKEYGLTDTAVAGVYATLSPNNLWDQNVRQGDRMVDIYLKHRHEPWDKLMDEAVDRTKNETVKTAMQDIAGKKYDELDTPEKRALWIRTYDEGHAVNNPEYKKLGFQPFAKISPEGKREGWYTKPVNVHEFRAFAWTSTTLMGKAVRILEANGDPKVIDESLRADDKSPPQHKVRSFYNNILDPHSANEDVTMDTHAVDAAWLMDDPIAVAHNFGDTPEIAKRPKAWVSSTPSNMSTGMTGNYAFNAEAYREAAHDLHLEPRELQSIVWETKRKWLETMTDENHQKMRDIWEQYGLGYLTQPEAQKQVKQVIDDDLNMTSQEKRDRAKQIRQAKALAKKSAQRVAA